MIRSFLVYLPSSVWELPPRGEPATTPSAATNGCSVIISQSAARVRPRRSSTAIVDPDSFFEIAPRYGRSRVTGLARLHGYPVGVMINNPKHGGGDGRGGRRESRCA